LEKGIRILKGFVSDQPHEKLQSRQAQLSATKTIYLRSTI